MAAEGGSSARGGADADAAADVSGSGHDEATTALGGAGVATNMFVWRDVVDAANPARERSDRSDSSRAAAATMAVVRDGDGGDDGDDGGGDDNGGGGPSIGTEKTNPRAARCAESSTSGTGCMLTSTVGLVSRATITVSPVSETGSASGSGFFAIASAPSG